MIELLFESRNHSIYEKNENPACRPFDGVSGERIPLGTRREERFYEDEKPIQAL